MQSTQISLAVVVRSGTLVDRWKFFKFFSMWPGCILLQDLYVHKRVLDRQVRLPVFCCAHVTGLEVNPGGYVDVNSYPSRVVTVFE